MMMTTTTTVMNTSPREGKSIRSNDIYYMNFNPKGNKCIWKTQIYFLNCRWYFMYTIITDLFDIDIHIFTVIKFLFNLVVKFKYINRRRERLNSITNEKKKKPTTKWWWRRKQQLWILVSGRERVLEVTIYNTWILSLGLEREKKRERVMEGTSERTIVEKIYNYHIFKKTIYFI